MHESFPSGEFENQKSVGVVHTLKSGRNRELRADRRSSARVPFALADQARDGKIVYSSVCRARDKSMEGEGEQDECININGGMERGYRRLITPSIRTRVKFIGISRLRG